MAQTCTKCNRANPSDAVYCYYDGMVLNGQGRAGGPVAVGAQTFNNPFVFPSGKTCRTFNELALACQDEWSAAKDLLRQGFLETFFGGLGRMDLAMAAKQSAQFPDHDRGLDDILGKLPVDVLQPARLSLETKDINLGVLAVGTEGRKIELAMENTGGRLVYGTASCPDGWLTFGDQPGINQKNLEFTHDYTLPVKVVGDRLRASNKPVETKILLETSGGTKVVAVRAEVPVKPFPPCVLGGAKSPRQVAEKAKANPKDAAPLFERGEVRNWYKSNGWTYPVQGPDASGIGAVQQFFEALGLTPPPKVDVSQRSIALAGNAGDQLRHMIEVKTEEKRPVYAHAVSDELWLEVGRAKLTGRTATISLAVPSVPNRPGQKLTAKLTVQSNGNQRFVIPVTLQVGGAMSFGPPEPPPPVMPPPETDFADISSPTIESPVAPSRRSRQKPTNPTGAFMNLVPAILLLLAVLGVVLFDLVRDKSQAQASNPTPKEPQEADPNQGARPDFVVKPGGDLSKLSVSKDPTTWKLKVLDPDPKLTIVHNDDMRFGLILTDVKDPKNPDLYKRLTYHDNGTSNNTIVNVAGFEHYFGRQTLQNRWRFKDDDDKVRDHKKMPLPSGRYGWIAEMDFSAPSNQVRVTQHVEIVPNKAGILDTCLVHYTVKNYSDAPRKVGLRVMLDTFIGANDGVPFTIPGQRGFLTTKRIFPQKEIPDYVEVIENPNDTKDLGTVVQLNLKGLRLPDITLEDIEEMIICRWPQNNDARWKWDPIEPIDFEPERKDSCVVLYWAYRTMNPGEERQMAFTYGLGKLDVVTKADDDTPAKPEASPMALSVPSTTIEPTGEFFVTAYLWKTKKGQKVSIAFPDGGLELAAGETKEKPVPTPGEDRVAVSWKVRAPNKTGDFKVQGASGNSQTKPKVIEVRPKEQKPGAGKPVSIFG